MDDRPPRRLTVELPADLLDSLTAAAELSHRTVDRLVADVLTREMVRWHAAFPVPAPPGDFQRALDADPDAAAFFATINRRNRHAIIARIDEARRPETRARRIRDAVAMLRRRETPYRS
jgi:hypothetical protein